ncbi:uncharacterized protein J3R85_012352 [Psidium guajava]|nr:uncharacterized protein J3R85_012352 [Psidium guajava]
MCGLDRPASLTFCVKFHGGLGTKAFCGLFAINLQKGHPTELHFHTSPWNLTLLVVATLSKLSFSLFFFFLSFFLFSFGKKRKKKSQLLMF